MPFKEASIVESRKEFVVLATRPGANHSELCRRFGISRTTGYDWVGRYKKDGDPGLIDQSRRPKTSPSKTPDTIEILVEFLRNEDPAWGAPKIRTILLREFGIKLAESTVHEILKRRKLIRPEASQKSGPWQHFERQTPNEMWQMDFKGYITTGEGRCYPLTILDDFSRYSLALIACRNEQEVTVHAALVNVFRRYGLPWSMLVDNGNPWGNASAGHQFTRLTVWLIRQAIRVYHSRPLHPQTLGKDERFHRTLLAELLSRHSFLTHAQAQLAFDNWQQRYNHYRPHESLGMGVPSDRYRMSDRAYNETLEPIVYDTTDVVRTVDKRGTIRFNSKRFFICEAFADEPVALRPTDQDGILDVYYCHQLIKRIDQSLPN